MIIGPEIPGEDLAKLEERTRDETWWGVDQTLFEDPGADINDFELRNYTRFLNTVPSLEDLIRGLESLSPLADDALAVAQGMDEIDFCSFKLQLIHERLVAGGLAAESLLEARFLPLVMPMRFIQALQISEAFRVPLGAAAIRIIEVFGAKTIKNTQQPEGKGH